MIPQMPPVVHACWQKQLAESITDPAQLLQCLALPPQPTVTTGFPLRAPWPYVRRMQKSQMHDPLLRQVLPLHAEQQYIDGYGLDPLGEKACNPLPGLLHKYPNRVLILLSGACAIHCRYCFRRNFPYEDNRLTPAQWQNILAYIRQDTRINEVIYSGGDPLMVKDHKLAQLTGDIASIDHIQRVRIHTRLPVVLPDRVTSGLLDALTKTRLQPVMVLHSNHGNEMDDALRLACQRLRQAGVTLLNQAVLLKGINDSVPALIHLSEQLFSAGVMPYYLHLFDKVHGGAHFDVPEKTAQALIQAMRTQCSGYLVPQLVREVAGAASKIPVTVDSVRIEGEA